MIEVVGILVAAGDGEHAGAQDVGDAVRHEQGIARIGNQPCQPVGDPQAALGGGQQHDAAIGREASAVKVGDDFLAAYGWKEERLARIVGHGGCGALRSWWRLVRHPIRKRDQQFTRHPPPNSSHAVNKTG